MSNSPQLNKDMPAEMPAFFSEDFAYYICNTKNKQKR